MNLQDRADVLTLKTLQCIKRKQRVFAQYIACVNKTHVLLKPQQLLCKLQQLATVLTSFQPTQVLILSSNLEHTSIYQVFAHMTGFRIKTDRYYRGNFNNCLQDGFIECRVLFTCHDRRDRLAIVDAKKENVKIVGLSNFARGYKYYDLFVPANTFSHQAMVIYFYLLYSAIKTIRAQQQISFQQYHTLCRP